MAKRKRTPGCKWAVVGYTGRSWKLVGCARTEDARTADRVGTVGAKGKRDRDAVSAGR